MKTNIFIPEKINVGFQDRDGTYTGKLAYVIYFDEKGKLRKEASWNSWRDNNIENAIYENAPTSGFVLNKKAGGYSTGWNHRQTYVRVYDPRGFEFEITVPNLLYILENTNSIKGKGLEGDFVYGWDGKDLVLMPTTSPDYLEISKLNALIRKQVHIKAKELKLGGTYLTKQNEEYIYLGKFDKYYYDGMKEEKKYFYFYSESNQYFHTMKSISGKFIDEVSDECADNYAELLEKLEHQPIYSPRDPSKYEYLPYTLDEVKEKLRNWRWFYCYSNVNNTAQHEIEIYVENYGTKTYLFRNHSDCSKGTEFKTLEELYEYVKPKYQKVYLENGNLYEVNK